MGSFQALGVYGEPDEEKRQGELSFPFHKCVEKPREISLTAGSNYCRHSDPAV